jgi:hypothetical protein
MDGLGVVCRGSTGVGEVDSMDAGEDDFFSFFFFFWDGDVRD